MKKLLVAFAHCPNSKDNLVSLADLFTKFDCSPICFERTILEAYVNGHVSLHIWEGFSPRPSYSIAHGGEVYHYISLRN